MLMRKRMSAAWILLAFLIWMDPRESAAADLIRYSGGSKCEEMQVDVTFDYDPELKEVSNFLAVHSCQSRNGSSEEWTPGMVMPLKREGPFKGSFKGEDHRGYAVRGTIYPDGHSRGNLSPTYPSYKCIPGHYKYYSRCYTWEADPIAK
jgi:hypothetical protein